MKERNKLGHTIRRQRENLGLSKSEFSRRVGVTPTAVHNWEENGVVPRAEMMIEIAKVLGVEPRDITEPISKGESEGFGTVSPRVGRNQLDELKSEVARLFGVDQRQVQITIRL